MTSARTLPLLSEIDEDARRCFEAAWRAGNPQPIESLLPPETDPRYLATLLELVLIEQEFRAKASRPQKDDTLRVARVPSVEEYLARFPQLNRSDLVRRLLEEEYRVRVRGGDFPSPAEYAARFPGITLGSAAAELAAATPSPAPTIPQIPGYTLLGKLGEGGMGVVYKARQLGLDRIVAIKMIQARWQTDEEFRTRFRREAEAIARLRHANIVQIYEIGEHDGHLFFSLEYLEGGNLTQRSAGQPLPLQEAAGLVQSLARAVHAAHQQGIVHRDLKPGNVLLTGDGTPKVTDFGLAKRFQEDGEQTQTGHPVGTPSYMAPEQTCDQPITPATDVYALGAVLYELLTGGPPFRAAFLSDILEQVRHDDPIPPRQLQPRTPRDLETICLKCLSKEPHRRYSTAEALAEDLGRFLSGEPIRARAVGNVERAWKWMKRRPTATALLTVSALGVVLLAVGFALLLREQARTRWAERQRIGAQVDALLDAKPEAVPTLLAGLTPFRDRVLDRLREVREPSEILEGAEVDHRGEQHRTRAALALLPVDAGQVAYLRDRLLQPQLDPEEMLLIREQLADYRDTLAPTLWDEVDRAGVAEPRRFRALVALAAFDPDNPRWPAVAQRAVGPLLAADPVHLGVWVRALRPVSWALIRPLSGVFRERNRPVESHAAATVLRDYAAGDAGVLASLLADADERSFPLLLPRFQALGGEGIAALLQELERLRRGPTPSWQDAPADPTWQTPDPARSAQIERAAGLFTQHFALCQTLPMQEFEPLAEALRPCGYRPVRCRPYAVNGRLQVAAVWLRDGKPWHLLLDQSADRVVREWRGKVVPVDVATYRVPGQAGVVRCVVLTVAGDADEEYRLMVGVPYAGFPAAGAALQADTFHPMTLHALESPDGQRPSYSAVWRRNPASASLGWYYDVPSYLAQEAASLHWDVSIVRHVEQGRQSVRCTDVWLVSSPLASRKLLGKDPQAHLQACRQLVAEDYRPAAIAVAAVDDKQPPVSASIWQRPVISEAERDAWARRQATVAAALVRLGRPEPAWPLLKHQSEPTVRSHLIDRVAPFNVDLGLLATRLRTEQDASVRQALILSLGEYDATDLASDERGTLMELLLRWYRDDPDPGVHSAIDWLLRHDREGPRARRPGWQRAADLQRIDAALAGQKPGDRGWFVSKQGDTFTVLGGPVKFLMGSPGPEPRRRPNESLHEESFGRSIAIATRPVTVAQFEKFSRQHPELALFYTTDYSPDADGPIVSQVWLSAVAYCRWLGEQENIPEAQQCYPSLAELKAAWQNREPVEIPPNFLSRTGYRLPTEPEWEYACRAGAVSSHYYGVGNSLLPRYAWYQQNANDRAWPVGQKRPNDFGLFDMHGNVWQWCQERDPGSSSNRLVRGGSYANFPWDLRAAHRFSQAERSGRSMLVGFRVVRTWPPGP